MRRKIKKILTITGMTLISTSAFGVWGVGDTVVVVGDPIRDGMHAAEMGKMAENISNTANIVKQTTAMVAKTQKVISIVGDANNILQNMKDPHRLIRDLNRIFDTGLTNELYGISKNLRQLERDKNRLNSQFERGGRRYSRNMGLYDVFRAGEDWIDTFSDSLNIYGDVLESEKEERTSLLEELQVKAKSGTATQTDLMKIIALLEASKAREEAAKKKMEQMKEEYEQAMREQEIAQEQSRQKNLEETVIEKNTLTNIQNSYIEKFNNPETSHFNMQKLNKSKLEIK